MKGISTVSFGRKKKPEQQVNFNLFFLTIFTDSEKLKNKAKNKEEAECTIST